MAHTLVTQVQQDNEEPVELDNNNVYIDDTQDEKDDLQQQNSSSCWSSCWQSFTACCSCPAEEKKAVASAPIHRYTPEGGRLPLGKYLLPKPEPGETGKVCLVLDLDETLVHSSFKPVPNPDFTISIELENEIHHVYVLKRPFVDEFLKHVSKKFEVVVFTASLAKYADPLLDILDPTGIVTARLFREACVQHYGNYVKDLSQLGRDLAHSVIIDNSPYSYIFQPDNAIPISSWFNDPNDRQLLEILPLLDSLVGADDVVRVLASKNASGSSAMQS